jgi:hypothetical protein
MLTLSQSSYQHRYASLYPIKTNRKKNPKAILPHQLPCPETRESILMCHKLRNATKCLFGRQIRNSLYYEISGKIIEKNQQRITAHVLAHRKVESTKIVMLPSRGCPCGEILQNIYRQIFHNTNRQRKTIIS